MYTQIKRTNGGEKNKAPRSFTFPHKGENQNPRSRSVLIGHFGERYLTLHIMYEV